MRQPGPKIAHLAHAIAHRLHVAQQAQARLALAHQQAPPRRTILDPDKPRVELRVLLIVYMG